MSGWFYVALVAAIANVVQAVRFYRLRAAARRTFKGFGEQCDEMSVELRRASTAAAGLMIALTRMASGWKNDVQTILADAKVARSRARPKAQAFAEARLKAFEDTMDRVDSALRAAGDIASPSALPPASGSVELAFQSDVPPEPRTKTLTLREIGGVERTVEVPDVEDVSLARSQ